MEASKYDAVVKGLLDGLGLKDDDTFSVKVEPHQITARVTEDDLTQKDYAKEVIIEREDKGVSVTVNALNASPAATGKAIIDAIKAHEADNGKAWRK